MADDDWFPLVELTARVGALIWVEQQVSAVLERWVRDEVEVAHKLAFAEAAGHHRWHTEILTGVLATSPELRAVEAVVAPTAGWQRAIAELDSLTGDVRVAALQRVVNPWLDRETGALHDLGSDVSDRPLVRLLRFVRLDHAEDDGRLNDVVDTTGPIDLATERRIAALDLS